eukprot:scaffold21064_cov31-Tisochrysis_lutea.AAC.1
MEFYEQVLSEARLARSKQPTECAIDRRFRLQSTHTVEDGVNDQCAERGELGAERRGEATQVGREVKQRAVTDPHDQVDKALLDALLGLVVVPPPLAHRLGG